MMKQIKRLLLLTLLGFAAAFARQSSGIELAVTGGIALPSSPMSFADYWKYQYGGGLRAGYTLSPSVTLIGSVEYYGFTLNADGVHKGFDTEYMRSIWIFDQVSLSSSSDNGSVLALSVGVRVAPSSSSGRLSPYFLGGVGIVRFALKDIELPITSVLTAGGNTIEMTAQTRIVGNEQTAGLLQGGVGLDYTLSASVGLFVEARYALGFTKGETASYIPLNLGIRMFF